MCATAFAKRGATTSENGQQESRSDERFPTTTPIDGEPVQDGHARQHAVMASKAWLESRGGFCFFKIRLFVIVRIVLYIYKRYLSLSYICVSMYIKCMVSRHIFNSTPPPPSTRRKKSPSYLKNAVYTDMAKWTPAIKCLQYINVTVYIYCLLEERKRLGVRSPIQVCD